MRLRSTVSKAIYLLVLVVVSHKQSGSKIMSSHTSLNDGIGQAQPTSNQGEYKLLKAGKGFTKDKITFSFSSYETLDGTVISTRTEFFNSTADMEAQFSTKESSFNEVIERSDIKNIGGEITGKRIVGKHYADEKGIEKYAVIRSSRYKVFYIESVSLNHILDFEKKFYKSQ